MLTTAISMLEANQLVEPIPQAGTENTKARDAAGKLFGVSGRSVSEAKFILVNSTDY